MPEPRYRPRICVWELTLACNCRCVHCGSSAGSARSQELTNHRALRLISELADLGCESVTFSGGEPLLRPDWPDLAGAIRRSGMQVELISNGLLAAERADAIVAAGFASVNFSVDGPATVHDQLRGVSGALERIWLAANTLRQAGVKLGAVTQVNRYNWEHLPVLLDLLTLRGFDAWQLQVTMPHGRALGNRAELCLLPAELPALERTILDLRGRSQIPILVGDNIGYMSCNEPHLRSVSGNGDQFWAGCQAGLGVIGITSDGNVRGCLSLPASFDEGNLRQRRLADIWSNTNAFAYNRKFDPARLTGSCAGCAFAAICRAGCHSLAVAASSEITCNPYCLHAVGRSA